ILESFDRCAGAILCPRIDEEPAGLVARRREHRSSRLGLWLGFMRVRTQIADRALGTFWHARDARVPPMQDQPMVRVLNELRRHGLDKPLFHLERVLAGSESRAIRH